MMRRDSSQRPKIFLCYRRDDASGHAGRLWDRLWLRFGKENIFMDLDGIEAGDPYPQIIEEAVSACDVFIAVIGARWLASSERGTRRLDKPEDFVRLEVKAALERNVRVIPILVQGAHIPSSKDLPDDIAALSSRQTFELSDLRWEADVTQLIMSVERVLAAQQEERNRVAREEAERQRRESEAQRARAREEARRQREAKEEERRQRKAGEVERRKLVPEQGTDPSPVGRWLAWLAGTRMWMMVTGALAIVAAVMLMAVWAITGKGVVGPTELNGNINGNTNTVGPGMTNANTTSKTNANTTSNTNQTQPDQDIESGSGIKLVWVQPGEFEMGSGVNNGTPSRKERLDEGFYMGVHEVTQGQWKSIMRSDHPSATPKGDDYPVNNVSWDDAQMFIKKLNKNKDGYEYSLPTEAQWEYACRSGKSGFDIVDELLAKFGAEKREDTGAVAKKPPENSAKPRVGKAGEKAVKAPPGRAEGVFIPAVSARLQKFIWFEDNSKGHAWPVTAHLTERNHFGLLDMLGNVLEWCEADGETGSRQALRGGSWKSRGYNCRCTDRQLRSQNDGTPRTGFRVVAKRVGT